jgi:hypothetical protein
MGRTSVRWVRKAPWLVMAMALALPAALFADQPDQHVLVRLRPSYHTHVSESYTKIFKDGVGVDMAIGISMPFFHPLAVAVDAGYHYLPVKTTGGTEPFSLSLFSIGLRFDFRWVFFSRLELSASGAGGYFFGLINDDPSTTGQGFVGSYGAAISFLITPNLSVGAALDQDFYLRMIDHIALGVVVTASF